MEHLACLRLIPNVDVWRPADAGETAVAWVAAIERRDGPTILALSRQNLPAITSGACVADVRRGAYVLADCARPRIVLLATGSEVKLALDAGQALADDGIAVRVVSMPCAEVSRRQDSAWKNSILPPAVPRVAIEAGTSSFWRKYVGLDGAVVGIDRFGESAPAGQLFDFFGFTVANVVTNVKSLL